MRRWSLLTWLFATAAAAQTVELQRVDIERLPEIRLELLVRDLSGNEVGGLTARDFEVRLDGEPMEAQGLELSDAGQGFPPVFLLLDRSGDLDPAEGHLIKKAAQILVEALPAGARVGIHTFDRRVRQELAPTQSRDEVQAAITNVSPGEGTSYESSLSVVSTRAASVEGAVVVYLVVARHYPGDPPNPGQAFGLRGHATPIYPFVLKDNPTAPVEKSAARLVRRLARGLPGRYRLVVEAPFGTDGGLHTLSVGLDGATARCRFKAAAGPGIDPSPLLEREMRRGDAPPLEGRLRRRRDRRPAHPDRGPGRRPEVTPPPPQPDSEVRAGGARRRGGSHGGDGDLLVPLTGGRRARAIWVSAIYNDRRPPCRPRGRIRRHDD